GWAVLVGRGAPRLRQSRCTLGRSRDTATQCGRNMAHNWLRVFRGAGASRRGHRRRQQQHARVVWPEKGGGLRGTAWHKMPVIAGFFGSGVLTALSEHEAAFFRYFKKG